MSEKLPRAKIGVTPDTIEGHSLEGEPVQVPAGSLLKLVDVSHPAPGSPAVHPQDYRYTAVLLKPSGEIFEPLVFCDGIWDGFLTPEPGILAWTAEDDAAARMQGWALVVAEGEKFELKTDSAFVDADNEPGRFKSDEEAWMFVWTSAVSKENPTAIKALAFLYQREPREYNWVKEFVSMIK